MLSTFGRCGSRSINARDAIGNSGTILIHTGTTVGNALRRRFPEAEDGQYVCISVSDTGSGMEEDVKSRIFESGFTTKDRSQGRGMGLSMVAGIVADHRGLIEVTSKAGHGSIFTTYLPVTSDTI